MSPPTDTLRPEFDPMLWGRLDQFQIDDPANPLSFARRLARENGWSQAFAVRVVDEYKRFLYLAMTAGHEVTPSDEVDQAWHLHLTYTRSYWDDLCGKVLGRPLHHGPTKGGRAEGERFEDQYERTLASYRAVFGEEPPNDIWPSSDVRFGDAASFVRVNRQRHFIIDRPRWVRRSPISIMGVTGLGAIGVVPLARNDPGAWIGIVLFLAAVFFIARTASKHRSRRRRGRRDSSPDTGGFWWGSGCSGDSGSGGDSGCASSGCGGGCGGCGG